MLETGQMAPDFTGTVADGSKLTLSSYRGHPVVLYFYPKANTSGCTLEARGFTEHFQEFQHAGVTVIGVSVDSVDAQRSFTEKCSIPFPLVADRDKAIAKQYGVLGLLGVAKRVTFFLDKDGRVTEVVEGMMPGPHVQRALQRIQTPPT
ncbi:MAG TPA: peroxiredoxin [Thermoplasmata archaeon]|nr:peroxiredoxin [Thermoplasmata archaeon]